MAISFTQVGSLIVAGLNAAGTYTVTPTDPRWYPQQIKDAANEADAFIAGLILADPNGLWRGSFTPTSSVVAHRGVVPAHVGMVVAVTVDAEGADLWPKTEIEWERKNATLSVPLTFRKHYFIDDDKVLSHNGTAATVSYYAPITMSAADPPVLQSPDSFAEVVASKALAFLFPAEGENVAAASFHDEHWRSSLAALLKTGSQ